MKIGILLTGHVAESLQAENGDYSEIFPAFLDGHGFEFETYAVVDGEFPSGPAAADGWLITGSRHGAYEDHPWIPRLEELIREIYAQAVPLVGVCFGHQIIAQALGGKVEKFQGGWSVGRQEYTLGDKTYALNAWHQDQVTKLPADAEVVSSTDFCEYAALVYGDRAFTIQPHPEINQQYLDGLLRERAPGIVPDELIKAAQDRLDEPTDSAALADTFARFFREKRIS